MNNLKEALDMLKNIDLGVVSLIHLQMYEDALDMIQDYINIEEDK